MERIKILDDNEISYIIKRGTYKRLSARIDNDIVIINIPKRLNISVAESFIESNYDKLVKYLNKNMAIKADYHFGSKYLIMGIEYTIQKSATKNSFIDHNDKIIYVSTNDETFLQKKIDKLIFTSASSLFLEVLNQAIVRFRDTMTVNPELIIKKSKRSWGYCRYQKNIVMLNISLYHVPTIYLEYVVYHELCHFKHQNHSQDFHKLLQKYVPNERKLKKELSKYPIVY